MVKKPGDRPTAGKISSKELNQLSKQITAKDVILVDQRGLSSTSLNNAILQWPVGTGGGPSEVIL